MSEDFKEARDALNSKSVDTNQDGLAISHPVSKAFAANQSATLLTGNSLHLSEVNLPLAVDEDPNALISLSPASLSTQSMLGCHQDLIMNNEDMGHLVHDVSDLLPAQESNLSLFGPLSQTALFSEKASSTVVSGPEAKTEISHVKNSDGSSSLEAKLDAKVTSLGDLEPSNTIVITEQIESCLDDGNAETVEGISTVVASCTTTLAVGLPQTLNVGMQAEGSNSAEASMAVSQRTPIELSPYVKVWEGNIFGLKQGNAVFLSKLVGYRMAAYDLAFIADWPDSLLIAGLVPLDRINDKYNVRPAGMVVFQVVNQQSLFADLFKLKLCARVEVPNHNLLIAVNKPTRLHGMLFEKDDETSNSSASSADATSNFEHQIIFEDEDD